MLGFGRTQENADGHRAQRVRRRRDAPRELHRVHLAPEEAAVVGQHLVQLADELAQVRSLPATSGSSCSV